MKSGFLCRKMKWEHRLVAVYQTVFSHLLSTYPNDEGFVIIEDDAVLNHPHAFVEEVCNAHNQQLEFYSLYQPPVIDMERNESIVPFLHIQAWNGCILHSPIVDEKKS